MIKLKIQKIKFSVLIILSLSGFVIPAFSSDAAPQAQASAQPVTVQAASQAVSATAGAMTFEDCYRLASDNNRDYKMAKLDKEIAEAELQKAAGSFGPTISLGCGYEPIDKQSPLIIPPNTPKFNESPNPLALNIMPVYFYTARVSVSQPVFTFGKTFYAFKIADEMYKIAKINFKKAEQKLNLDVISSFYGALIAQELYTANLEALKSTEEYLKITKTKYDNGQASNFDVLQAQVQYANAKPDLRKAEDASKLALEGLKNVIGMDLDKDLVLDGTADYKKLDMSYDDIKKQFLLQNSDRSQTESAANIAKYTKNLAYAALLPNIAVSANYTNAESDAAFHREDGYWTSSWDVTIGLQWTLFDSFRNVANIKEANANQEKAQLNKENVDNLLSIQLDSLFTSMQESSEIIEAADSIIKQAEEGYRIAQENYKNGLIQSVDLMNAEIQLLKARTNYLNAFNNYVTTIQKLKNFIQ